MTAGHLPPQLTRIQKRAIGATAMRERAVLEILLSGKLHNEAGEPVKNFTNAGRDALDFMSISKATLQAMLNAAYIAGRENGKVYPYSGE